MEEKNEKRTPLLQLFKEDNFDVLKCPECGVSSLHHYRVEYFDREQDDHFGLHVSIQNGKVTQDQDMTDNPSTRRGGLSIFFWCESCNEMPVLRIAQHKGQTEVKMTVSQETSPK